jgi:eukaryotic-like serine/threonine-protein kinase
MPLQPGTRLGPYEVLSLIGSGGMGEVYRARDTRLDRPVALKILAPELANDAEFRARFTREAKAISALNHAHICGLYDIGCEHDTDYLVLELLEGETLAARLARGALPLAQVLRFGIEIADALEAAHRQGIVHRDLKPGNVMLTPAGTKLLDFGLAKHDTGPAVQGLSMLATAPGTATAQGTIIGTLKYMAPEQVQGHPADARTDIFALGALLYEMATGRPAFDATTQASLMAKILETDPPVVSSLAPLAPPVLDHVVQTCLAKAPADRWQTAHDVRLDLQWIVAQGSRVQPRPAAGSRKRVVWWLWGMATAGLGALVATVLLILISRPLPPARPMRFDLTVPSDMRIEDWNHGVISPDGQRLVFEATVSGNPQLVMRDMASSELVVLAGTEGAWRPFWSPDGRSLAFFHPDGHLKQVVLPGGLVRVLADSRYNPHGNHEGTWRGDRILFVAGDRRLYSVAAGGGTPRALDLLPHARQRHFASPSLLPDGRRFLLSVENEPGVYVASLEGPGIQRVMDDAYNPLYRAGHLFYSRGTALFSRPFNPERLEFFGTEVQVSDQAFNLSVSDDGTVIVYRPTNVAASTLTWFDRGGRRTGTLGKPGPYQLVVLSPQGRHATVVRGETELDSWDLWDGDVATGPRQRSRVVTG